MKLAYKIFAALVILSAAAFMLNASERSIEVSQDGYNVTVYNNLPISELERKLGQDVDDNAVALTDKNGNIWVETAGLNRSEVVGYCNEMVLYNYVRETPELDKQWYHDAARNGEAEPVCELAASRAEKDGLL